MIIELTGEEILSAVIVGARRLIVSMAKGLDPDGSPREWKKEIEGALAEAALARETGNFFDPRVGRYKSKDVGDYHVRQTDLENGCLIIREKDPDGIYVLIVGSLGRYRVVGFIASEHAKTMMDCRRAPAGRKEEWFIPQDRLTPWGAE